ncbi:retrovirus-related pol polyprotein from transposon TNT 1-94 [Tanacetum coccineum]
MNYSILHLVLINQPPEVIAPIAEVVAPEHTASTSSPSSTTVDQDALSPNVAHMNKDPFFGILIPENDSEASSSSDVIPTIVHTAAPNSEHVNKWTKDHPLDNIIGELRRPVSIRLQLHEQALFSYYDACLTSVEPKNYKDVFTQACWIKAMQEELNEFERLEVWEVVPRPNKVLVITLKWIYKYFAPVDRLEAIQIFLAFATHTNMIVYQMDVKTTFLNDILREKLPAHGTTYCRSFYSLGNSLKEPWIPHCSSEDKAKIFSCDHRGSPWWRNPKMDKDPQGKAINPTHYRGMVGTLMYLTASRPDLTFIVCMCAWYQAKPTEKNLHAVKRIFKYLRGTVNKGLWYPKDSSIALTAYVDADHAGCQDTRRSTSGSMQLLGDRLVSWSSKRQKSAAISSLGFNKIPMYCDNKSAIALCCNNVQHSRSKHIDIRFHFIKEQVENGVVELYFVNTEYQLADIFTKALCRERIEFLINKLGMRSFTSETLKQLADEAEE